MKTDKTIISTLLILCLATVIPTALYFRKLPKVELLPSEKVFINFSTAYVSVIETKKLPVFSGLDCPVKAAKKQPVLIPPVEAVAMKLPPSSLSSLPKVSMIYYEFDATKKAIIGGHIVQAGSTFENNTVLKIEKTRVQIRSAGKDIWLNIH